MTDSTDYGLEPSRFESVLGLLTTQYEKARVTRFQRLKFRLLKFHVHLLPPLIVLLLACDSELGGAWAARYKGSVETFLYPLLFLLPLTALANTALIGKALRQFLLARRMAVLGIVEDLWGSPHGWSTARKLRTAALFAAPALLFVLASIALGRVLLTEEEAAASALDHLFVYLVSFGLVAVVWLLERLLERIQSRLAYYRQVKRLRDSLQERKTEAAQDRVELPPDSAVATAVLEGLYALENRAEALRGATRERAAGYAVSIAAGAGPSISELESRDRQRVERAIVELASQPKPRVASYSPADDSWRLPVPETEIEIVYSIDKKSRAVEILSLARR